MQTLKRCYHQDRDVDIINMLSEDWELLTVNQLVAMKFFPSIRVAQRRMNILFENGDVQRRYSGKMLYYFSEDVTEQVEHKIGTNWGRIYLMNHKKNYEFFESFHYEQNYGAVRPDGLLGLRDIGRKNEFNVGYTLIEMDRSNNKFDKVDKYNKWYDSRKWEEVWWYELTWGFPRVFIITTTNRRKNYINKKIRKENVMRLPKSITFDVFLYKDIIKECMKNVL